jgi:ubiquinone/menaquinone biosynthesis C-methylase UbiE
MTRKEFANLVKHLVGGHGAFPHQLSFILESRLRRRGLPPGRIVDRLHLKANSEVLEVGPGPGVFSVEIARRVPEGRLELFDLQPEMLERARRKLEAAGLSEVAGYTAGDACEIEFPDGSFDVAFLIAVLGELPEPRRCLERLHRILRPGGLLSVTESLPDPDFSRFRTLRALVEGVGFAFAERFGPAWSYTANFRRPA